MGRVVTPTYRVEYRTNLLAFGKIASDGASNVDGKRVCVMSWRKHNGRANAKNLEVWRKTWNESFKTVNRHLMPDHIYWARIVHQNTARVVAEVGLWPK